MFQNKKNNVIAQKFLFIDAGILDQETLLKDLQPEYHIIKLESNRDPIIQITDALSMSKCVQEVILVVHARPGQIVFSNYELDLNELHRRSNEFEAWQKCFISSETRICIYACELASDEVGRAFIQELKNITGAEIAASSLPVGRRGGKQNWNLDFLTKPFEVFLPFSKSTTEKYPYTLAPTLSFSIPFDDSTHQIDNDIQLFFGEIVVAGIGNIIISNGSDTRTIDVTDTSQVTINGSIVTINPATDLVLNTTYNIQMASGVITDTAGNAYAGISDSTTLNFTTIPSDPLLSFSDPFNGSTHQIDHDIELFFNETVVAGIGNIIISNGSDTRTIDVTDTSQITFNDFGSVAFGSVSINPIVDLLPNTTYNIQMASGVITDTAGYAYAGISDSTTLNFTTIPTDPLLSFSDPFNGSTHQIDHDIELFFNETVVAGIGNIIISNGSDTRTIDVTDTSQVTFSDFSGVVTINPTTDLVPNTTYNIQMASGVITDTAGNAYAGISGPATLNFTTNQGAHLISGLGGAANFGEQLLSANDDDSTDFIDLSSIFEDGINFSGRMFTGLWINNNGSVTFNGPRENFTPDVIASISDNPEISPFFADVDTRGSVVSSSTSGNSTGSNLVYYDFDAVNDRFIVTWDDVGYFGAHTDKLNAFQLILTDQSGGDFDIEFRYEDVNWTTGDASGSTGGLGFFGTAARAGFTAGTGDPAAFFELPASGNQDAMLALDETIGNTGDVGRWLFNIRSSDIAPLSINVGENTSVDEGNTLTRTITFTDGEDTDNDGWTYSVDYGDGSVVETGTIAAGVNSFGISHVFADGDDTHNVSVTVTDKGNAADSDTKSFVLSVNNIAPTINLSGSASVNEGETCTLNLNNLIDPGADTVSQYIVNWGDGSAAMILTAAQLLAAGNNVTHIFADGASNPQITVDLVDEDGTHVAAGSLDVIINNVAPTIAVSGASEVDAGATYTFNLGAVTDPGDDTVTSYIVNWGDGSSDTYTTAGDVTHVYSTTGNAAISVDLVDEDGIHIAAVAQEVIVVGNAAPTAVEDSYAVSAGASLIVNTDSGVLSNDSDADGDSITAQLVDGTSNGILSLQADGSFTYTPSNGFSGIDTFTYRAFDGIDQSGDTSVAITVRQPSTGPEPEPTGSSKQVNTFDEGDQITPSVTALSNDTFAVAWVSRGQDGDGDGIYGQIVDTDGNKIGSEFRLSSTTAGDQQAPRLAALEGGGFVAVWDSFGQDGDKDAIVARRFDNEGAPLGNETLINETTASWQVSPDITGTPDGGYAVAWHSEDQDGSFAGVYARRFANDDTPLGGEFQLNVETDNYQSYPRIATLVDGRLAAVWESEGQDGDGDGIFARTFAADGTPEGIEFQANEHFSSFQSRPDVAALAGGGFAIAWTSYGQDGDRNGVYTRAFNADGTPAGSETQVAQTTRDNQEGAAVIGLVDGTYLVGFTSDGEHNGVTSPYMARFDANGFAQGGVIETKPFTNNEARLGSVAITDDGAILEVNSIESEEAGGRIEASAAVVKLEPFLIETIGNGPESLTQQSFSITLSESTPLSENIATKPLVVVIRPISSKSSLTDTELAKATIATGLGTSIDFLGAFLASAAHDLPKGGILPLQIVLSGFSVTSNIIGSNEKGGLIIADAFMGAGVSLFAGEVALKLLQVSPYGKLAIIVSVAASGIANYLFSNKDIGLESYFEAAYDLGVEYANDIKQIGQDTIDFAEQLYEKIESTMQEISIDLEKKLDQGVEITAEIIQAWVEKISSVAQDIRNIAIDDLGGDFIELSIDAFNEGVEKFGNDIAGKLTSLKEDINENINTASQLFDGANRPIDPIVLDLDRNGIKLVNVVTSNARFDMDADGFAERTAWVAPDDAFLVYDRNDDGIVNDISEFFGSSGIDGFAELEGFDTNRDGIIASDEPIWAQLKLWNDLNGDGSTDSGELTMLDTAGINQLSVRTTEVRYSVEGNLIPYVTTFNDAEGEGLAADVFFQVNQFDSAFNGNSSFAENFTLDPVTLLLPFLRGYGNVPDLYIEMSINPALKDLVAEFAQLLPEDYGRVRDLAEQIIYRWTRVEDVAADSRGEFFNGQKLAALEAIFGESFDVNTRSGRFISNNPTTALMGQRLAQSWDALFEGVLNNLMVQVDFGGAFDNVVYDIATDAPLLIGSLEDVISAIAVGAPVDTVEAIGYWRLMSPILDKLKNDSNANDIAFKQTLSAVLAAQGITYTYEQLSNAVISEGIDNQELTGTEREELFVGSGANEDFSGGQGGDVYLLNAINWGHDRVVEVTSRADESSDDVIVLPEGVTLDDIMLERIPNGFILRRIGTDDEVTVQTVDLPGADGDFGVEILRFSDDSEVQVAVLLGEMTVSAGEDVVINEGGTFTRRVEISDSVDEDDNGWTYQVAWSDGISTEGIVAAGETGFDITREFTDDVGNVSVNVTVADSLTESDTDRFDVMVVNIAPTVALTGSTSVDEGSTYTLALGAITDPGIDTVTDYVINWGDGSTTALTAAEVQALSGNMTHVYADGASNPLISVNLVDEDGTHTTAGTLSVTVNNVAPTIAISGAAENDTGASYTLNLDAITDPGQDTVTGYIVNWGDGGSDTYNSVGEVIHTFAVDGNYTISVDLVDEDGTHTAAGTLAVTVNTVIIPASVSVNAGVDAVINEGSLFTRTITFSDGEDAGADGWTYSVDWGDGSVVEMGNIAVGVNSFDISRFFADGDASHTVSVTVTDTTGDTNTRQFVLGVNNVAPVITLIGNASVDEGSAYTLTGSVFDPGADTVTDYIINWGDGTTTALTAAEVQALSGNVSHVYADGASNPLISVDLVDEDGTHTTAGTLSVTVNNIAPTIAISGAAEIDTGASYMLNLDAITDPGQDTVTGYIVNWGDGTVDTFSAGGDVSHVYSATGNNTITVDLIDEDGTHVNSGNLAVTVNAPFPAEIIRIGDAPLRVSRSDPNAWENAWTDAKIAISHKADYLNNNEVWSSAAFNGNNAGVLSGGDIFGGDLGVSGQTLASSTIRQEIDGTEALRFDLDQAATKITINLSRLDGNSSAGHFDAGRLQLLDDAGTVVNELIFNADALTSDQQITLEHDSGFSSAVLTAGVYNGADFIFGGLSDATGQYQSDPQNLGNGAWNASEYLVDAVEFEFGEITLVGTAA